MTPQRQLRRARRHISRILFDPVRIGKDPQDKLPIQMALKRSYGAKIRCIKSGAFTRPPVGPRWVRELREMIAKRKEKT